MRTLYLGIDPPVDREVVHYPVIHIVPTINDQVRDVVARLPTYSHLLFTSKTAVRIFLTITSPTHLRILCIGRKTGAELNARGFQPARIADDETSEGVVSLLEDEDLENGHLLWPHSALSRPVIGDYLQNRGVPFTECHLYTTQSQRPEPIPNLNDFDEIVFTSPSSVDGFLAIYGSLPRDKVLTAIGPITKSKLE